ncbi:hypothetical protein EON65_54055, partial [archaeon]
MAEDNWNLNPFVIVANGLGTSAEALEQTFTEQKTLVRSLSVFNKHALVTTAFALPGSRAQGITAFRGNKKDHVVNYINAVLAGYKQNGVCSVPNPNPLNIYATSAVPMPHTAPAYHAPPVALVQPAKPVVASHGSMHTSPPPAPAHVPMT